VLCDQKICAVIFSVNNGLAGFITEYLFYEDQHRAGQRGQDPIFGLHGIAVTGELCSLENWGHAQK
jgi:hypothetical protein